MSDKAKGPKPEKPAGVRDELGPKPSAGDHTSTGEWLEDPQQVYEDALSEFGILGVELAEALREEAISRNEALKQESGSGSAPPGGERLSEADKEILDKVWDYWLRTKGPLDMLPHIFDAYLPTGFPEDIRASESAVAAFGEYIFDRYEVIVDGEWLQNKYPDDV